MPFWPFKRNETEQLTAAELRDRLIQTAATGSRSQLHALCNQYKVQIAAEVEFMCTAPMAIRSEPASMEGYIQCLGAVAECLAQECGAPELWNRLCGTPDTNPLLQWEAWYEALPQRADRLEHAELIDEARQFIDRAQQLEGNAARKNEAFLQGRLGDLLFHCGDVANSIGPYQAALAICRQTGDVEGEQVYLNNLLQAHRYLGNTRAAIETGEAAIALARKHALEFASLQNQVHRLREGEPLCRVVCVRDGKDYELNELVPAANVRYEFQFRRNRLSLQKTSVLVRQGNELASAGKLADALEKYQQAMEVDPYDPDPVYQYGMCLLELGTYGLAREAFDEVERLAPGWFRCRFDRWLAEALETQAVTENEFRILRVLEDGGLPPAEAQPIALRAVQEFPQFAAFCLVLGDIYRDQNKKDEAIACYRQGLELVAEPDLESRLLCAIAAALPMESPERQELVKRAVNLDGSLIAKAMVVFIPLK